MKKKITFLCIATFLISCNKNKKPDYQYRRIGYIYNSIDSTPFINTQFKVYRSRDSYSSKDPIEIYFSTSSIGYFDVTTTTTGSLVWPSFFEGAGYTGPTYFTSDNITNSTDEVIRVKISNYDTIYTTPYH